MWSVTCSTPSLIVTEKRVRYQPSAWRRDNIGVVFQYFGRFHFDLARNVALGWCTRAHEHGDVCAGQPFHDGVRVDQPVVLELHGAARQRGPVRDPLRDGLVVVQHHHAQCFHPATLRPGRSHRHPAESEAR